MNQPAFHSFRSIVIRPLLLLGAVLTLLFLNGCTTYRLHYAYGLRGCGTPDGCDTKDDIKQIGVGRTGGHGSSFPWATVITAGSAGVIGALAGAAASNSSSSYQQAEEAFVGFITGVVVGTVVGGTIQLIRWLLTEHAVPEVQSVWSCRDLQFAQGRPEQTLKGLTEAQVRTYLKQLGCTKLQMDPLAERDFPF